MAKTPKIRFKNFNDEWVENKYKNIGQCLSGGTLSYEDLDKNGIYKCILYGELYTRYDYIIKNIVFRTNKLGNKVIKNDILFPQSTTVNAISLISPACMNDDEAQTSGVFAIRPHKNIDGNFITYYTKGNFYQRNKLAKNAQGLTIVHLYYQSIKDETILIPNLAEQCKISEFFAKLDKLIALHQSKFEKLQKIKKSCLQNLFPQNNQNTPKIRFTSFSKPWETRKFSDTFIFLQNNSLSRAELSNLDGEIINIHYGDILIKYTEILNIKTNDLTYILDNSIIKKYQASTLQNGDIIIADAAEDQTVGKCSEITGLTNEVVLSGLHTIPCRPNEKHANGFLGYYMNSNVYHDQLLPLLQGTKVLSISKSALQNTDIIYPSNLAEQRKISDFFSKLDKLISLHQSKFEKLQKIKKSCLQNMFV